MTFKSPAPSHPTPFALFRWTVAALCFAIANPQVLHAGFRVSTFDVDASPPVGSPLAYDPTKETTTPLSCRGIVILPDNQAPIVLCAIDWIGVANEANFEFRERLANAVKTDVSRVTVHALHQHDAPRCDFTSEAILEEFGHGGKFYDLRFSRDVFQRAATAAEQSLASAKEVTSVGFGAGEVKDVASNRRILGDDGKVKITRYTACRDPKIRALPAGTIDPMLKLISFRSNDDVVATLTFYATHPQSYYRTGQANPDFPGMARNALQKKIGSPVIHFNGAGGNIGAGKWNDGSHENRQVLADKVLAGMETAADNTKYHDVSEATASWNSVGVSLPIGDHVTEENTLPVLRDPDSAALQLRSAAAHLAWFRQTERGIKTNIGCLSLGDAAVLFMPGELFVEYQLNAQKMAPERHISMAAYGDYGAGYIGTEIAYSQGGYETSDRASRVSKEVERVLTDAMKQLLAASE